MHVPTFGNGLGLEVHVRTKVKYDYSYIATAAIRIGEDILEVGSWGAHLFNGVDGFDSFPTTMGDFATVSYTQVSKKKHTFEINLGNEARIFISSFKEMVSVTADVKALDNFKDCVGLIGSTSGAMVTRDGTKSLEHDPIAYGKEWQVRDTEAKLFQNVDHFPQFPEACVLPDSKSAVASHRRLGAANGITDEAAKIACAKWNRQADMEACMYDIIATGDLEMAQAGNF